MSVDIRYHLDPSGSLLLAKELPGHYRPGSSSINAALVLEFAKLCVYIRLADLGINSCNFHCPGDNGHGLLPVD